MTTRNHSLPSMLLSPVPTLLTLALLAGVAWLGIHYDWKIPRLPVLLRLEAEKSNEEEKSNENDNESPDSLDKPLPPVKLASEEAARTAGIRLAQVEKRSIGEYLTANGDIDFDQNHYAHLSSRAAGTAWSIQKQVGDTVKKGEVLALIASPEVAKLKFDLQQTLLTVQTRQLSLKRLQEGESAQIKLEVEKAHASLREARIHLFGVQQSLQNLGLRIQAEELLKLTDEQLAERLRMLGIPDALRRQLEKERLESDKRTNNLLPMYAPFDGVVVERHIVDGEIVNMDQPQFVLADLRNLWIMLHVRLEDMGKVKRGQQVIFHLDGPDVDAPPATIVWISEEVEEKSHTLPVRAEVANTDERLRLRPRTFGTGRIRIAQSERLVVPNAALQFDGRSHLVFVRLGSDSEFQPVRVRLGPRHDRFTEIVSGVQVGQLIAAEGSHVVLSEMLKKRIGGED